jgi:cyanate permease
MAHDRRYFRTLNSATLEENQATLLILFMHFDSSRVYGRLFFLNQCLVNDQFSKSQRSGLASPITIGVR